MLERPLNLLNIVCTTAYINFRILWVLYAKTVSGAFIVTIPTTNAFLEVPATFSYRKTNVFVIELGAIELQEVYQVFT